jgi:hypothetical protein
MPSLWKVNNVARYLAFQIILGKLKYGEVVSRFPKYKNRIDTILKERGYVEEE